MLQTINTNTMGWKVPEAPKSEEELQSCEIFLSVFVTTTPFYITQSCGL